MTFRQQNKADDARWLQHHRHALLCAGVPARLLDDAKLWSFVLWHGEHDFDVQWGPSTLSAEDAAALLDLLVARYPASGTEGPMLIEELRKRVGRATEG